MRGIVGCVRWCWLKVIDNELEPDRTEKFGDSCGVCAASVTVEHCGRATLALTRLRARTHVRGKNMHARTHGRARAHACTREKHLHVRTQSTHTQHSHPHMRTAGEHIYSTFDVPKPATLPASPLPSLNSLTYHDLLPRTTGLHRHIWRCPSRHPLADRALKRCHTKEGVEKRESPRTGPARRACTCGPESDDSCAPVCIAFLAAVTVQ